MRPGSPPFGFSTLTTSAPSWARTSVQVGPASNCDKSSTRTPARQFGAAAASVIISSVDIGCHENSSLARRPPRKAETPGHETVTPASARMTELGLNPRLALHFAGLDQPREPLW